VAPKISKIDINNRSNLKYRKRLSIIILSNIAQPYYIDADVLQMMSPPPPFRTRSDDIADHHLFRYDHILFHVLKDAILLMVVKEHARLQPQCSEVVKRTTLEKGRLDSDSPNAPSSDLFIRHYVSCRVMSCPASEVVKGTLQKSLLYSDLPNADIHFFMRHVMSCHVVSSLRSCQGDPPKESTVQ
jgi:hypothetical protein